ncbi:hypothetical protein [Streptomyces sp. NPDC048644]|uniref:hypothetical protein n=1 Tax=Streptomyces sp. NPDC048644 TaxID=3365582 RepID=UPI0037185D99
MPIHVTAHQATWTDSGDRVHQLRLTPTRLARGAPSDLAHVRLDDSLKGLMPYYLTVSYTNTGKSPISAANPESNFSVNGVDGRPGERVSLMSAPLATSSGLPEACRESGSAKLAVGETAEVCQIFMLPKEAQPATVSYQDDADGPLIWKVDGTNASGAGVLPAGRQAGSVWEDSDGRRVTIDVTPKSVRAGVVADLSRFDLDADEKKLVPYYVTVEYRNTGTHDLYPSMQDGVVLRSAGGRDAKRITLIDIGGGGVSRCPGALPNKMVAPGRAVTQCSIHMLPKEDHPVTVVFQGQGADAQTIIWRAALDKERG